MSILEMSPEWGSCLRKLGSISLSCKIGCASLNSCYPNYYLQKIIALADASLLVVVPSTLRVFLVEDGRVVPPRTEVDDAILMSRVEFGEFFRQGLHWRKHKLERNLGDRPFFLGFEPLWDRRGRVEL
jgi:hypothetical protein